MNIAGSTDITKLSIQTVWDLSGTNPQILLENLSEGADLASCSWWFVAMAPGDIPIHEGTESTPDITGSWTTHTLSDSWPKAFNNILWSGAPYTIQVFVKDGDGNVYEGDIQSVSICRPSGNTPNSTNTFGLATCAIEVNCAEANVFFQDTTNATYQGITGTIGSSTLKVVYPVDETGNIPDPFVAANFSTALVPITYSSDNYQYQSSCIYQYDFGGNSYIRIKYQSFNSVNGSPAVTFAVLCNINLCGLFCEVEKLVNSISNGNCADAEEAQQKLNLINPKLWLISMGIQQPLCGVDVPALIEEVKVIGGFDCNCCNAPTGIIPSSSSVIDGYNFQIVPGCGDITGTVTKNGNNIQIQLNNTVYTFKMCDNSPAETTAFNFTKEPKDGSCVSEVCLNVDVTQLSYDILNNIKGDAGLVNLFNSIVISGGAGSFNLVVDGKCIFSSATSYNYQFIFDGIPTSGTYAILESIDVSGTVSSYSYAFNMSSLASLQTFLNGLGIGSFVVSASGANQVTVTSTANTANINSITYSPNGIIDSIATMTKTASGYTPIPANTVVQNIINYLCGLNDSKIKTSTDYEICYIDPNTGTSSTQTITGGSALSAFITALLARGCDTIEYIQNISGATCSAMKTLFAESKNSLQSSDYVLGVKNNDCARITINELFLKMLKDGAFSAEIVTAFCELVAKCSGDKACTAYNEYYAYLVDYDTSCPTLIKFYIVYDDSPSPTYTFMITFANPTAISQTITVDYRQNNVDVWTNLTTSQAVTVNGTTLGTAVVSGLTSLGTGTYDFRISNNCQSPAEYVYLYNVYIENLIP